MQDNCESLLRLIRLIGQTFDIDKQSGEEKLNVLELLCSCFTCIMYICIMSWKPVSVSLRCTSDEDCGNEGPENSV